MKAQYFTRLVICVCFFLAITPFDSFAQKKVSFNTSTVVPNAEGTVKVKKDNNGNYNIEIDVENLPDPKKLTPSKKIYVAWVETNEKRAKNIGQMKSSSSLLSKMKKASIKAVSIQKPTKVFITAEDDGGVDEPGSVIVLTTNEYK